MLYAFTGAMAYIKLKKFDEASVWCDQGLAVSFTRTYILNSLKRSLSFQNASFFGKCWSKYIITLLVV